MLDSAELFRGEPYSLENHWKERLSRIPDSKVRSAKRPQGGSRPLKEHQQHTDGAFEPNPKMLDCTGRKKTFARQQECCAVIRSQQAWMMLANLWENALAHRLY